MCPGKGFESRQKTQPARGGIKSGGRETTKKKSTLENRGEAELLSIKKKPGRKRKRKRNPRGGGWKKEKH